MALRRINIRRGDVYGFGTVIREIPMLRSDGRKQRGARLRCQCGSIYEASLSNLRNVTQPTLSCGCFHRIVIKTKEPTIIIKHGLCWHEHYQRWNGMMQRCYNDNAPNYDRYGGRGIEVCDEWHDPQNFIDYLQDNLGPRPANYTLDRIDNDGNYEPGNVRWASMAEQRRNQRRYLQTHGSSKPSTRSVDYRQHKSIVKKTFKKRVSS